MLVPYNLLEDGLLRELFDDAVRRNFKVLVLRREPIFHAISLLKKRHLLRLVHDNAVKCDNVNQVQRQRVIIVVVFLSIYLNWHG